VVQSNIHIGRHWSVLFISSFFSTFTKVLL